MSATSRPANRLSHETSPYLLQHAKNPVDWYPWGPEALERARREDRPILLSIGYAACHWCHVMERESFENEDIARLMNESFVCIKVDREERPDLDEIYMTATVAMTGHGGWPMTVFLTPDQRPFFAGTYFPPEDGHGRPGFRTVLERLSEMWTSGRERLLEQAAELTEHVQGHSDSGPEAKIAAESLDRAAAQLSGAFDPEHGGFGQAPKFPPCASLSLLLRLYLGKRDPSLLRMVTVTLDAMKNGGIYDQLGGGFARYSVDEEWLVPHFEKMLYDNAQLARVYLEAWQATGDPEYRRVAAETLDYVIREMQSPEGGYYSATDADSEGVEGKFFVWSPDQVEEVLGRPTTDAFCAYYDVTPEGNWEGVSILRTRRPLSAVAGDLGTTAEDLHATLLDAKRKLYGARLRRVPPLTDDKVLTSWNGLMISAMAEGARVLGDARYRDSAERATRFILAELSRPDGGLYRTARAGKAHLAAYLEDYAFLSDALVDLYESGSAETYLHEALRLADRLILDFGDERGGAFFQTAHGHETLIARTREGHDGAIPSANAVAARALARLAAHTGREDLRERAQAALRAYGRAMERAPRAFATSLAVVDFLLEGPVEIAVAGDRGASDTEALLTELGRHPVPNRIIGHLSQGERSELPLLAGKTKVDGRAALYVCRQFTCQAPVTDPAGVAAVLGQARSALETARAGALGVRVVPGRATALATRQRAAAIVQAYGEGAVTSFGATGLTVSRLGFGCYRVDARAAPHREALSRALARGVNLVDTSTNYTDGFSERLVGEVVRDLRTSGTVQREAVILVSKVGYAQGSNLKVAEERKAAGRPFPEMVEYGEGLWHCIHPEWIEDQLGRSLERLGVETLDVCLLHNPEYFLGHAAKGGADVEGSRSEFYRRVTDAFRHLEGEVRRGRIAFYGVSSNTLADADSDAETTRFSAFLSAAREAGGDGHHFRMVQVPLNLLESGPALRKGAGELPDETLLEAADRHGVAVLVNRPLNAIVGGELVRLADPPDLPDAPAFGDAISRVRELEQEFRTTFARGLAVTADSGLRPDQLLHWADQLGDFAADVRSFEQWRDAETHAVAPRIMQVISALDQAMSGPLAERWAAFRERYVTEMDGLLRAIRKRAADRSRRRSVALARALDPLLEPERRSATLSQKALHVLASLRGVTCVLAGMREARYVDDALPATGWQPTPDASRLLEAAGTAEVG